MSICAMPKFDYLQAWLRKLFQKNQANLISGFIHGYFIVPSSPFFLKSEKSIICQYHFKNQLTTKK